MKETVCATYAFLLQGEGGAYTLAHRRCAPIKGFFFQSSKILKLGWRIRQKFLKCVEFRSSSISQLGFFVSLARIHSPKTGFGKISSYLTMMTFCDRILVINSCDFPQCSAKDEDWDWGKTQLIVQDHMINAVCSCFSMIQHYNLPFVCPLSKETIRENLPFTEQESTSMTCLLTWG